MTAMAHEVRNHPAASRYELFVDGEFVGFADYEVNGDRVVFPHTEIVRARRGQGLGAILVQGALDDVRPTGRAVVPSCWYVAEFIDDHPEYQDLTVRTA
jgi:predicted GNAT family acetyltransferase